MAELPNLNPGHHVGCTTRAVYPDGEPDVPPALVVTECAEGCPHRIIELEASDAAR